MTGTTIWCIQYRNIREEKGRINRRINRYKCHSQVPRMLSCYYGHNLSPRYRFAEYYPRCVKCKCFIGNGWLCAMEREGDQGHASHRIQLEPRHYCLYRKILQDVKLKTIEDSCSTAIFKDNTVIPTFKIFHCTRKVEFGAEADQLRQSNNFVSKRANIYIRIFAYYASTFPLPQMPDRTNQYNSCNIHSTAVRPLFACV